MHHYALGFAFCDNEVCLVTKAKPDWQQGKLNGIGGSLLPSENYLTAMIREFKEETGHQTCEDNWKTCLHLFGQDFSMYVFRMFADKAFPVQGTIKEPVGWYNLPYVLGNNAIKIPNLQWIIPMLLDKHITFPLHSIAY